MSNAREDLEELGCAVAARLARGPQLHGLRWAIGWLVLAYAAVTFVWVRIYYGDATAAAAMTWLPPAWGGLSLLGVWRRANDWYDVVARWTMAGWLVLLTWAWLVGAVDRSLASLVPLGGIVGAAELAASEVAAAVLAIAIVRRILCRPSHAVSRGAVPIPVADTQEVAK